MRGGNVYDGLRSNVVVFCWSSLYPELQNYCKGVHGHMDYQVLRMIHSLYQDEALYQFHNGHRVTNGTIHL